METANQPIMVSIICNAYNQERYIRQALESFVTQVADFPFEVLVHDDASTDGTADIIREYEAKYPGLILPIYQTVNQYSLHVPVTTTYQYPRVRGKYIAMCEGDDYWTDPLKLQKQVDALESHPDVDMCACASVRVSAQDGSMLQHFRQMDHDGVIPTERVISGGGGFLDTASLFYRKELEDNKPPFRKLFSYDYSIQIHGALRGGIYYIADEMCAYRAMTQGSSTQRMKTDPSKKLTHYRRVIAVLKQLNIDTHGRFRKPVMSMIFKNRLKELACMGLIVRKKVIGR